jgi:hypothetical protein
MSNSPLRCIVASALLGIILASEAHGFPKQIIPPPETSERLRHIQVVAMRTPFIWARQVQQLSRALLF